MVSPATKPASPSSAAQSTKPEYGIDAPIVITNLALGGALCVGFAVITGHSKFALIWWLAWGAFCFAESGLMLMYSLRGKFVHRDRMLAMREWRGDEQVLDVGTGKGLMMIGAAKRLTTGRATGIDIWSKADLSGNDAANTLRNVELEGVSAKCEIRSEDARKLSFPDASFDVVVSNLCIHNIVEREGRAAACREIARVLKPAGVALVSDFKNTAEYEATFRAVGLEVSRTAAEWANTFPPLRVVVARKSE